MSLALLFAAAAAVASPAIAPSASLYAYTVDYRPLDGCAPPACHLSGDELVGWWDEVQGDGGRGAYARIGEARSELYFRRARVLRANKTFEFALTAAAGEHDYDGYFAAPEGGDWQARIEVLAQDGHLLWQRAMSGTSKGKVRPRHLSELGRYADYFGHVRLTLPSREQAVRVRIVNSGSTPLAIGSPLVLRKELGRAPRQAMFVITDAVPEPLMLRMLTGSGDAQTEWLSQAVRERGTFFPRGTSPAFNSPTFVRRFFRNGFYETDGEMALFGQGIDEQAPATPPSPVTRLAEQGFQTELTVANFMLLPTQTRLGFDGGYHNEQQTLKMQHSAALVRRFATWISEHPHDDALNVIWFSATHDLPGAGPGGRYTPGREAPPFELQAPGLQYAQPILDGVWRNLLQTVDHVQQLMSRAREVAPDAERVWFFGTDHGRMFTSRSVAQPVWLPTGDVADGGSSHCCAGSFEEAHTPFAILYDGAPRVTPSQVDEPTSAVAFWRLLERSFGVNLALPATSTFHSPALDERPAPAAESDASRWDEELLASAGDSGSIRAVADRWAFRSLLIRPQVAPLFGRPPATQLALTGTPNRGEHFLAEELYDRSRDPFEQENVADQNEETVLELRRKVADWLAVYYDPPSHPRYEYSLSFPQPVELTFSAPQAIRVAVDGGTAPEVGAHRVTAKGRQFVLQSAEGASIVDIEGGPPSGLVRCQATGLPLEALSSGRVRLNLALARTNCVSTRASVALSPADVAFRARLVDESLAGSGTGMTQELVEGLRSWGYVRDLDQAQRSKDR
ncbi:MAG: hypothetical protein RL033_6282 [Pseudomonadota bacterium]